MNHQITRQPEHTDALMQALRTPTGWLRSLNISVLVFFVTTFYAPSALAIKTGVETRKLNAAIHASLPENRSEVARYSNALARMKQHFQEAERLYADTRNSVIGRNTDIEHAINTGASLFSHDQRWAVELKNGIRQGQRATKLSALVEQDFVSVEKWIKSKSLAEVYQERHKASYLLYLERYREFEKRFKALMAASDEDAEITALKSLNEFLADLQFGRSHQAFDGERLGNSAPVSAKDKPLLLSKREFFFQGLESNPKPQVAALGDYDISGLVGADDPAYLAESDEVVFSTAIQAQAAELDHDAVKIHHWVRNNIETLPGWGSYQNSDLTLAARRGNPMDVASLLIALLRASGIPARYAIGVAEVDADRYNNWLGNFESATVAASYANSNGIATQLVTGGGKVTRIRTQHIWVQAAVDFFPSRGAKNRSADSWIELDPSFKQYEYQQGLDALQITGIDAESLANQFVSSGTVDEDQGFVQNLDPTALLNAQEQAQQALQDYIDNNLADPSVGDVIGGRRTIIQEYPTLPSGLPYGKYFQGPTYGELPNGLQNKVTLGVGETQTTFTFAEVNNQKVTLKFTPANEEDEAALAALLPEGEITDISQLPSRIPSYLVNVIPELALNGEVFAQGSAMQLGQEIDITYQISGPNAQYASYPYKVPAGSFLNIPIVAQSVSPALLEDLRTKVETTRAILESGDETQIGTLTREDLLGDLFYAGGLGYFAQYNGLSHIAALQSNGAHKLEFGYGSVGYEPNLDTFFGIPRAIEVGGAAVNMRLANTVETHTGKLDQRNQLRFQAGLISSALEHAILEQMFSDPNNPTDGVSAVKALQLAAQQGQRIYQIDQTNLNAALAEVNLDISVETEIRDAVTQGRIVITHTNNIQVPGWSGAGYVILDADTFAGSYKISGGGNGGFKLPELDFDKLLFTVANFVNELGKLLADLFDILAVLADSGGWIGRLFSGILKVLTTAFDVIKLIKDCSDSENFATALWAFGFINVFIVFATSIGGLAIGGLAGVIAGIVLGALISRFLLEPAIRANCEQ